MNVNAVFDYIFLLKFFFIYWLFLILSFGFEIITIIWYNINCNKDEKNDQEDGDGQNYKSEKEN